jgi:hypothetical protein
VGILSLDILFNNGKERVYHIEETESEIDRILAQYREYLSKYLGKKDLSGNISFTTVKNAFVVISLQEISAFKTYKGYDW